MSESNNQQNKNQTPSSEDSTQNDERFEESNNNTPDAFIESDHESESHNNINNDDQQHSNLDEDFHYSDDDVHYSDDDYDGDDENQQGVILEKLPIPGSDDDFYENYYESYDPESLNDEIIKPPNQSDEAARLFRNLHGVEGVIRENARLAQTAKATRRQMFMSTGLNIALSGLVIAMVIAFTQYPKTRYIPTTDNKAICEVTPENNPNITDVAIADFAKDAILNLYTFDYVNHEDQINASLGRWFSADGRIDTIAAMQQAGIMEYVKDHALTLRAGTTAAAKIEKKGRTSTGNPYWVVRFPMVVDVYSGGAKPEDSQNYVVSVRIVADDASAQNPKGLAVASAALEPRG